MSYLTCHQLEWQSIDFHLGWGVQTPHTGLNEHIQVALWPTYVPSKRARMSFFALIHASHTGSGNNSISQTATPPTSPFQIIHQRVVALGCPRHLCKRLRVI